MNEICAVIVTYNRKELLFRNIDAILQQSVAADLYIYDNCSTDGTEQAMNERYHDVRITYFYATENTGGAGGFSAGVQYAYEKGYKYIWMMDDDGYPLNADALSILLEHAKENPERNAIYNSLVVCNPRETGGDDTLSFTLFYQRHLKDVIEPIQNGELDGEISSFNSTFFGRELVEKIGTINADFFIYGDDTDYLNRAQLAGYQLITIVDSRYYHPDSKMGYRKIFGKIVAMREQSLRNTYYYVRNYMYIVKTYQGAGKAILHGIKVLVKTLLYREQKWKKLQITWSGLVDGYHGRFSRKI